MKKALFVGGYPNTINKYHRVFFKNFIEQVADSGIECYVIAPISITKLREKSLKIPTIKDEKTAKGTVIHIYRPRFFSFSNFSIGSLKMRVVSEHNYQNSALKVADQLCREHHFDFVYGHFFLAGGLAAVRIGEKYHIPSYIAFGESSYKTQVYDPYGELSKSDIKGLSGIISVSQKNTRELQEHSIFEGVPILTAPNAVDLSLFHRMDKHECRNRLNLPNDEFIVGFVGGFCERKGDKRVLEAVNRLEGVVVAYAGRGDDKPSGEKVVFCKAIEHESVPVFLNAIDLFCLPTLNEGSCNAIVEAGACGVPIISSDLPFNDDLLTSENSI